MGSFGTLKWIIIKVDDVGAEGIISRGFDRFQILAFVHVLRSAWLVSLFNLAIIKALRNVIIPDNATENIFSACCEVLQSIRMILHGTLIVHSDIFITGLREFFPTACLSVS